MNNNGQVKPVVSDRQKVERVLDIVRTELESPDLEIFYNGDTWEIVWHNNGGEFFVTAKSLDDAYILARHKAAGTEPAPF